MSSCSFSPNIPNKIGDGINVSGKNTLIKTDYGYRVAIADEPIDAKVDGKKMFCVRVDNSGAYPNMLFGFTPTETFDSDRTAYFGNNCFTGCGIICSAEISVIQSTNITTSSRKKSPTKRKKSSSFSQSATTERRRRFVFLSMEKNQNRQMFLKS